MSKEQQAKDKIVEWMEKLEQVVSEHGGEAVDLGLTAIQVDAIGSLTTGLLLILASTLVFYASILLKNKGDNADNADIVDEDEYYFGHYALFSTSVLLFIFGVPTFFYWWNWIAAFWPKVYVAHKAIEGVL